MGTYGRSEPYLGNGKLFYRVNVRLVARRVLERVFTEYLAAKNR
jgi:hypothetical protein